MSLHINLIRFFCIPQSLRRKDFFFHLLYFTSSLEKYYISLTMFKLDFLTTRKVSKQT